VGPDGSSPTEGDDWTWSQAESADDAPDGWAAFAVGIEAPEDEGSYDYAVRVRRGGQGAEWVVCDLDGSANGYEAAMAGELLVQEQDSEDQNEDQQDEEEEEDEQEDQQDEEEEEDEQEDQQDEEDEREDQQDEEDEQELPQDMESVLDALQQNEQTFMPPRSPRQVVNDW
jgi:hypothetical protein